MGEVYRARDTRLNRDVALKFLPSRFIADPERRARFARERVCFTGAAGWLGRNLVRALVARGGTQCRRSRPRADEAPLLW